MARTATAEAKKTTSGKVQEKLAAEELRKMDAYWRALNYLAVGQIYLLDNPLLREPLKREHIKPRLLGHWGTSPGLGMLCVHLNRVIKKDDLNLIYIIGPGHGSPSLVAVVPRRNLQRVLPQHQPGRRRNEATVQAVPASQEAYLAPSPQKRPVRSMKAANSACRGGPHTAPHSTIRI
ncbi:MAG: hypothetical protein U0744_09265 [Gemmataceae bacterium]